MEAGFEIRGYRRIHVYTNPESLLDAAKFIAGALLLSHGIRRDTVAVVKLRDVWLIALGDKVRHLRPDEETLEGWIKAVLRGARLGVIVARTKPAYTGYRICLNTMGPPLLEILRTPKRDAYTVFYSNEEECDTTYRKPDKLKEYMIVPLVNIVLDNLEYSDTTTFNREFDHRYNQ